MKLYVITFKEDQVFTEVRNAGKKGDPNAVVTVNRDTGLKVFEVQSERAAHTITKELGGKVEIIEYDITKIYS